MRAMLIKGQSAYDALRVFIDSLAAAFVAQGHEAVVIDLMEDMDPLGRITSEAEAHAFDLVFTYCILGEFRDPSGRSLSDIVGAPHVIQHVDYPLTHGSRLDGTSPKTSFLVIDRSHVEAIKSVYGSSHFANVEFSPHAAIGTKQDIDISPDDWARTRDIPILFTGTFYQPSTENWPKLSKPLERTVKDAIDIALSAEWMPALDAFDQAFRDNGFDPTDPKVAPVRKIATLVHEYVRAYRRFELLKTAAKLDLPLHIYGSGYDRVRYRFQTAIFGGDAPLAKVIELMGRSRIVLNINANFGAGSHERPLTALLAGAVAATDHSHFFADHFAEGQDMVFYRWKSLRPDLEDIAALAEAPDRALKIAKSGQKCVDEKHLWSHRVASIIMAAQAARSSSAVGGHSVAA